MFLTWAASSPLYAGPDEHTHVVRAASVSRGQIIGRDVPGKGRPYTQVRVPAFYGLGERADCWVGKSDRTPECTGPYIGSRSNADLVTYAGRYFPLYYGFVGIPGLVLVSAKGLYAMRAVSALLVAYFVTGGLLSALSARRPVVAVAGVAFALTPMAAFLAGVINPNGVEIAAAICLWATLLALLDSDRNSPALVTRAAVAASALAVSRLLAPLWLALIVGLVLLAFNHRRVSVGYSRLRLLLCGGLVVVSATVAILWVLVAQRLTIAPLGTHLEGGVSSGRILRTSLANEWEWLRQMIGVMGWLDTPSPSLTYVLWIAVVGMLLMVAVGVGRPRTKLTLAILTVAVFVLPAFFELATAREIGLAWQGRYMLPLAVGIPILGAWTLAQSEDPAARAGDRVFRLIAGAFAVSHLGAYIANLRRNTVGLSNGPLLWFGHERWSPPLPSLLLLTLFTAFIAALLVWYIRTARAGVGRLPARGTHRGLDRNSMRTVASQ